MTSSADGVRRMIDHVGVVCLAVAVATAPWNAVAIGPVKLAYVALVPALAALGAGAVLRKEATRVPVWVWVLAGTIVMVTALSAIWPVDGAYVAGRYADGFPALPTDTSSLRAANVVAGVKWVVAVVALPVTVCLAVGVGVRIARMRVLVASWLAGVTASATVALVDQVAGTRIAGGLLPSESFTGRQAGLSIHPNHLALSIVMVLPVVVWSVTRYRGTALLLPSAAGALMVGGLLVSGSRAGFIGAAMAVSITLVVEPRTRRLAAALGATVVALALALAVWRPQVLAALGQRLRFVDDTSAAASDSIRAGLARQAWADFGHSPVHGIGFEILSQGHDIYLQLLANGGVILLIGFVIAQLAVLLDAWTARGENVHLLRALAVAVVTFLIIGVAENQLADLFVYIPFALVAGLRSDTHGNRTPIRPFVRRRATVGARSDERSARRTSVGTVLRSGPHPTRVVCPA